mgnify:CR=1 FL=1
MVWDGVYVPRRSRIDPEEAALMTDPRYFAAASRAEEEAKKKNDVPQPKQNKKHKREKDPKSQIACIDVSALEEMMERVARRVYYECRKEDVMRESSYLLGIKERLQEYSRYMEAENQ